MVCGSFTDIKGKDGNRSRFVFILCCVLFYASIWSALSLTTYLRTSRRFVERVMPGDEELTMFVWLLGNMWLWAVPWFFSTASLGTFIEPGLMQHASAWMQRRASALIWRIATICVVDFGALEGFGRSSHLGTSAGWGPYQWMYLGGQIWPLPAAQWLACSGSECWEEPQNRQREEDAHTLLFCQSQNRVHWGVVVRHGRTRVVVLQPNRKRTRGSRLWASSKRTIQIVDIESGNSALSLEGDIDTGLAPVAEDIASEIESKVTGTRTCSSFSFTELWDRETFEMRYDVHSDAISKGASPQIFFYNIFSSRAFRFPLKGQSEKPVLVSNTSLIRSLSDPSSDLM